MRSRVALALAVLLLAGLATPAAAAPDKSPVFVDEPIFVEVVFPNPCLGETYEEIWWFDGHLLIHEFTNPSGNTHYNNVGYIAAETESGFSMPEKMIGVDVENISDNTVTFTGTGLYQLRNDDNDKLRLQLKIQTTVVDGDVKVDLFNLDIACLGNY